MTITIGNTPVSNWKHLKMRYVAFAGVLAIAAGAVVAVAPWHQAATPAPVAASAAPTGPHQTTAPQNAVVYLVGSESEAVRLRGMIAADGGTAGLNESISVVVVDTPEMEADVAAFLSEPASLGDKWEIIDLRDMTVVEGGTNGLNESSSVIAVNAPDNESLGQNVGPDSN